MKKIIPILYKINLHSSNRQYDYFTDTNEFKFQLLPFYIHKYSNHTYFKHIAFLQVIDEILSLMLGYNVCFFSIGWYCIPKMLLLKTFFGLSA